MNHHYAEYDVPVNAGFGGTAIGLVGEGFTDITDAALQLKLVAVLSDLPLTAITSLVGIIRVIVFFRTSSDSGSLVMPSRHGY